MLNARLYRVALVPFAIALAVVSFSLTARPRGDSSTLAPDAFEGQQAFAQLRTLAAQFPDRSPGSAGDARLAATVAHTIEGLGGTAGGGFQVQVRRTRAQTVDGRRTLETVIASRPGSTSQSAIVIVAHRDSTARGAEAQLSGTAALLELARVFSTRETQRPVVLVSTSGGSGGDAGASQLAAELPRVARSGADAAIVLGDLASTRTAQQDVIPYSDGYGNAPVQLAQTVSEAIAHEAGLRSAAPSALGQLAHLAFGFAPGEQGVLNAAGVPAVLVQASGEGGPAANAPVSAERLEGLGKAVLSAVDALDASGPLEAGPQTGLVLSRQLIPAWALRLLIGTLLLAPLIVLLDGLARARRRSEPVGRWSLWALSCALPFLVCALFALVLGALGALAAPAAPPLPAALTGSGSALAAVLACALVLALAWLLWPALMRRLGLPALPSAAAAEELDDWASARRAKGGFGVRAGAGVSARVGSPASAPRIAGAGVESAGVAALALLAAVAAVVWLANPYAALLIVPALHLLLPVASPQWRPRPWVGLSLVALALAPLALLIAFYAHRLGYGPGAVAWSAVLLVAGGQVSLLAAVLWSVALGCVVALALVALAPPAALPPLRGHDHTELTIRGPLTYAGPGSLGGTESALRR